MKFRLLPLVLLAVFGLAIAAETDYPLDAPAPAGLRPGGTLTHEFTPPPLHDEENKDIRRERNYPEQPPTIPHTIRGYQVDRNSNRCLAC
ncbi:MAG: cytochrome C, partial [Pseudomonas sp.]|nr:cytochrome C [Pseudomonas sp.]